MRELPDYAVVVAKVNFVEELGGAVTIAAQKVDGQWYGIGMGEIPTEPEQLTNFFPATLVYTLDGSEE